MVFSTDSFLHFIIESLMNDMSVTFENSDYEHSKSVCCWLVLGFIMILGDSATTLTLSAEFPGLEDKSLSVLEALSFLCGSCFDMEVFEVTDSPKRSFSSDILID